MKHFFLENFGLKYFLKIMIQMLWILNLEFKSYVKEMVYIKLLTECD